MYLCYEFVPFPECVRLARVRRGHRDLRKHPQHGSGKGIKGEVEWGRGKGGYKEKGIPFSLFMLFMQ